MYHSKDNLNADQNSYETIVFELLWFKIFKTRGKIQFIHMGEFLNTFLLSAFLLSSFCNTMLAT